VQFSKSAKNQTTNCSVYCHFLTGQIDKKTDCLVKNRTPGNPTRGNISGLSGGLGSPTGSALDQQSTNDRKVASSRPTKVVCITVLTGNRMG